GPAEPLGARALRWAQTGGMLLQRLLFWSASVAWYVMFAWWGRAAALAGDADAPAADPAGWQALFALGGALYCVANLLPVPEAERRLLLVRRICGYAVFYGAALLVGFGLHALGAVLTVGGVALLRRRLSLAEELERIRREREGRAPSEHGTAGSA
ncbi:MAG: hypothetical protein ACOCX4_06420, partial [Planctomycetota bacterium]